MTLVIDTSAVLAIAFAEPCLELVWHGVGAATPCRGWLRGVGGRSEPRV